MKAPPAYLSPDGPRHLEAVLPSAGPAVADSAITTALATGAEPATFSCRDLLTPGQLDQARQAARQLYPTMLSNTEALASFGNQALDQVNAQVSRIFRDVGRVDIPELTSIMMDCAPMRKICVRGGT
ncbi:hypothetical protein [Plantactinospora soyae]|uniref:hypothetical protein n=1 Tax=Plantactinospora soyae TaxID=1544732 RepID=UPI001789BFA6|nr:hypothetical protein [Plantactinospora soyae]